jgi:hypothetical protein
MYTRCAPHGDVLVPPGHAVGVPAANRLSGWMVRNVDGNAA